MPFDPLEIQKIVEEKRLVFGKKLEEFLLKRISEAGDFLARVFRPSKAIFVGLAVVSAMLGFFISPDVLAGDLFVVLRKNIFPVLLLCVLCRKFLPEFFVLLATIAAILILLGLVSERVFYATAFPLVVLTIFSLLQARQVNWKKDGIFFLPILILPQVDPQKIFPALLDFIYFWWLLLPLFWQELSKRSKFAFPTLAALTLFLSFIRILDDLNWVLAAVSFLFLLSTQKTFSHFSSYLVCFVFSYILVSSFF
ncbi:MAG: hypothetical protein FJX34_04865 [Alphaproteobacteria bacterium]|nr:hypothetical protein [Alphaproteobacteria bacterium]